MLNLSTKAIYLVTVISAALIWFLYLIRDICLPFLLSAFFAYLLSPLVTRIQATGLKRGVSVILLYLCFFTVFVGTLIILVPRLIDEVAVLKTNLPQYFAHTKSVVIDFQQRIERKYPAFKERAIVDNIIHKIQQMLENEIAKIPSYLFGVFALFSLIILIPVLTFFMLLSGEKIFNSIIELIPSRYLETGLGLVYEIDSIIGKYIRGQMIATSTVGFLSIIGLFILGIDYAVLIGVAAGFANLIPYVGPSVGAILAGIVGIIKFQTATIVIKIIVLFVVIQLIDNNITQPLLVGGKVNLPPIVMIFSLMVGAQFFGLPGMVVAVPTAAIIKVILRTLLVRKAPILSPEKPIIV